MQCQPAIRNFRSQLNLYSEVCLIILCFSAASPFLRDLLLRGYYSACLCSVAFNSVGKNLSHSLLKSAEWEEGVTWGLSVFLLKFPFCSSSSRKEVEMPHAQSFSGGQPPYSRIPKKNLQIKSFIMNLAKEIWINIRTCEESFPSIPLYTSQSPRWHMFWSFSEKVAIPLLLHPGQSQRGRWQRS